MQAGISEAADTSEKSTAVCSHLATGQLQVIEQLSEEFSFSWCCISLTNHSDDQKHGPRRNPRAGIGLVRDCLPREMEGL